MQKIILTALMLIFGMTLIMAQAISEYTFSTATDGSLEDMSSGTTDLLPTGTYYYMVSSAVADIGFGFNFGPGLFSQFSANSNGQMQLGNSVIAGAALPEAGKSIIAPLSVGYNSIQTTGKVHYKVFGTAPNRKLVVEWLDLRIPYGNFVESGTYSRMQAWLYETTNVISFVYGTMYRMGTVTQNRGIAISTSNVAGTVGNVTTFTTTPTWNTAGTSTITTPLPTNVIANLDSPADGSRRVFTFTPPAVSVPPNPAILVGPENTGWVFTDATLSWNGGGGQPTSYDLYFGTDPNPPFVANLTAGYYAPVLAAGTQYYWKVVPKNAYGEAQNCPVWSFRTPTATQLVESFEAPTPFPPPGWMNTSPGFSRSATPGVAKHGTNYAIRSTSTLTYMLSTPLLSVVSGNTLDFYAQSGTALKLLQIMYSSDRTTWTQLGADISFAAINVWYRKTVDLSSLAGQNVYLGFRTASQTSGGNILLDYIFGPEIQPEVPNAVNLTSPINGYGQVVVQPTFTWATTPGGGVPTEYRLYLDTNPDPATLVATVSTFSYTLPYALNPTTTYYWKVIASNSAGDAPASAIRSFTTTVNTPLPAVNPVPADGSTGVAINAALSWDATINTSYYKVYYGTTLPATPNVNQVANSWTPPTMAPGTTYYWKVVPFHQYAGEAVGSPTWSFTTMTLPLAATNPIPADTATDVIINATLSWDAVPTAASYDVYFGTTLPGTPNANVLSPSWIPPVMDNSTLYSWKVVPKNAIGEALNCPTWTFTTGIEAMVIPLAATNPYPADLATGIWPDESLSWDAVIGAASYDVYFGTILPLIPNANVTAAGWTPPLMDYNTLYSWMVVPKNAAGEAINNPVWSFTTSIALPLAAVNPEPTDTAVNVATDALLSWDAAIGADSYDVYFGTTLPGTPNANVLTPGWTPPLMDNDTVHYWQIIPKNAAGEALNCPIWSFTTIVALPLAATNPYPADLATGVWPDETLSWDVVSGATSYDVYFGITLPATPADNVTINAWTPPLMEYSTQYVWMVVPKNAAGEAVNTPVWSFTTGIPLPLAASNPVPADLAVDVAVDATFYWDSVAGADSYDVYFGTILPWTPNANVLTPGWTPPLMDNNTWYEWMVVPKNSAGEALDCPIWSFTTIGALPLAATNPYPADLATGIWPDEILSWDEVTDATSYDVYFGTTLPATPTDNVTINVWVPPLLEYSTQYVWMVVPKNAAGSALNTPVWTFTTIASTFPAPANLQVSLFGSSIVLSWDAVPQANTYRVYGANDPHATEPWTLLGTTSTLSYIFPGTAAMYFFRVTADLVPVKSNDGNE